MPPLHPHPPPLVPNRKIDILAGRVIPIATIRVEREFSKTGRSLSLSFPSQLKKSGMSASSKACKDQEEDIGAVFARAAIEFGWARHGTIHAALRAVCEGA